ncbi:hypothetical protein ACVWZD_006761 [Streptomyces sp. TE3672]
MADSERAKLMKLRYTGAVGRRGFALYLADSDRCEDSTLPTGSTPGTPADTLDAPADSTSPHPAPGTRHPAPGTRHPAPGTRPDASRNTTPAVNPRRTSGTRGPLGYRERGPHCSVRKTLQTDWPALAALAVVLDHSGPKTCGYLCCVYLFSLCSIQAVAKSMTSVASNR